MKDRELRQKAREIFFAAIEAVHPSKVLKRVCTLQKETLRVMGREFDLSSFEGIYVVGAGKGSAAMARSLEEVMGDRIREGMVVTKYGHSERTERIRVLEAGHPIPDESGVEATSRILELLSKTTERDLVICLLSGGGSALLTAPEEGISLSDIKELTRVLLLRGVDIKEMNTLRKHLSRVKGGKLAKRAFPSQVLSLIISDVVGDDLSSIASGPTYPDPTTFRDCLDIIERYDLEGEVPPSILKHLKRGREGKVEETLKEGDPVFSRVTNIIIGNNLMALEAAKRKAEGLGFRSIILSSMVEGEAREVAKVHTAILKEVIKTGNPVERPACILSGGETTVTVRGNGKGGRNQEFALAAALEIVGLEGVLVLGAGTDGTDGPTDAAGAFADGSTVRRGEEAGLDPLSYLRRNDSYNFFKPLSDLFVTGPTGTNVMDLRIMLVS